MGVRSEIPQGQGRRILTGVKCQSCGKTYTVDLNIPDRLWNEIADEEENLLCGECIMRRIEQFSSYDYWFLTKSGSNGE